MYTYNVFPGRTWKSGRFPAGTARSAVMERASRARTERFLGVDMFRDARLLFVPVLGLIMGTFSLSPRSEEIAPGTVVDSRNVGKLENSTFEGVKLGDLLPTKLRFLIESENLKLRLVAARPYPRDWRIAGLTKQYAPSVSLNPSTDMLEGYVAGIPFPDIDIRDPKVGIKLMWNHRYGRQKGDIQDAPINKFLLIDGHSGLEREQLWRVLVYDFVGIRRAEMPTTIGDGAIFNKAIIQAIEPHDIKGLGTLTIRYTTGQLDDVWAYIRAVRRVRRLSGGAWMDPIGGTDWLQDDFSLFNAFPTWYQSFKVLGRTKMLVMADNDGMIWNPGASSKAEQYPTINLTEAPYWNLKNPWEIRSVWVIEATPPGFHPYSKRILYMGEHFDNFFAEMYDHKGELWKTGMMAFKVWSKDRIGGQIQNLSDQTRTVIWPNHGIVADHKIMHAMIFVTPGQLWDTSKTEEDLSLAGFEAGGR